MTNRKIERLTIKFAKQKDDLRKTSNALAAAQRAAARREARCREQKCLALGAAIEEAVIHQWSEQQTGWFLDAIAHTYPADVGSRSLRGLTEAGWISYTASRARRMHWATVGRVLLQSSRIDSQELASVIHLHMPPPLQGHALAALADIDCDSGAIAENARADGSQLTLRHVKK